ncbi:uncharacterized protein LAJ45_04891 [Morchella importuna]|uniref:uncharacterized protein n=1 Tax=Morchella importuna TaxID=1174673 RepID=UPI001E8D4581|nr:uncharacterized protein LAJ45_04891 [Morchella importuna]KAH8151189.1 hypothetical protein LAJ45_04891 [Morchella importuna]
MEFIASISCRAWSLPAPKGVKSNNLLVQACCDFIEDGTPVIEILDPHYKFEAVWERCINLSPNSRPSDALVKMATVIFLCWAILDLEKVDLRELDPVIKLYNDYAGLESSKTREAAKNRDKTRRAFTKKCTTLRIEHAFRGGSTSRALLNAKPRGPAWSM